MTSIQKCVFSPLLFNLYAEFIFREALNDHIGCIRVNGVPVNNFEYADDTVILAGS